MCVCVIVCVCVSVCVSLCEAVCACVCVMCDCVLCSTIPATPPIISILCGDGRVYSEYVAVMTV